MPTFTAPDGTRLAYRLMGGGSGDGDGDPVLCVPAAGLHYPRRPRRPLRAPSAGRPGPARYRPVRAPRTTPPATAATAWSTTSRRCARTSGRPGSTCLATPAGANIATQYAARYPERVGRLALIGPGTGPSASRSRGGAARTRTAQGA